MSKSLRKKPKLKVEIKPKRYNQKVYNRLFLGGLVFFFSLAMLSFASNFIRNTRGEEKPQPIKQVSSEKVDYRLQNYLDGFVYYYFTFSDNPDEQERQLEKLNGYYADGVAVKAQALFKVPSELRSYKLLSVDKESATYLVSYSTRMVSEIKTEKEEEEEKEEKTEDNVVEIVIPYKKKDGAYYVSDLPYFTAVKENQAKLSDKEKTSLDFSTNISKTDVDELDRFFNLFFSNYVSSQENLDLLVDDVKVLPNTLFNSIEYSAYVEDEEAITAYIQVAFSTGGSARAENFTFKVKNTKNGYKILKMQHGLHDGGK